MAEYHQYSSGKPEIDLSLNQAGLIILFPSGVTYHNQTCGTACLQRYAEGILVLLTDPYLVLGAPFATYQCLLESKLRNLDWLPKPGITEARAAEIDTFLKSSKYTEGLTVDREQLAKSEEAWVWVNVEPADLAMYSAFGSCKGVLVWPNSD